MTSKLDLAWAEAAVDRSNVAPFIERAVPVALQRQLSIRTLLLGIVVTAMEERPLMLSWVWTTLCELEPEDQRRLGVIGTTVHGEHDHQLSYRQVEDTFRVVMLALDYRPVPAFRKGIKGAARHQAFLAHQPSPNEAAQRRSNLEWVCDALLEASMPRRLRRHTAHALDWTDVHSRAADIAKAEYSTDPSAGWRRKKKQDSPTRPHVFFGYHEQSLTIAPTPGATEQFPELVRRIELYPANEEPSRSRSSFSNEPALTASLRARSLPTAPTRTSGLDSRSVVTAIRTCRRPPPTGLRQPRYLRGSEDRRRRLVLPSRPGSRAPNQTPAWPRDDADLKAWDDKAAKRDAYRFRSHGRRADDGCQRYSCPARRGAVRCPLVKTSWALDPTSVPTITIPPTHPPKCCQQHTITVPPNVAGKTRQKHIYLSPKWREDFRDRTSVERSYSPAKSRAAEDMSTDRMYVIGVAKVQFLRAFGYMAMNYRLVLGWVTGADSSTGTGHEGDRNGVVRSRSNSCALCSTASSSAAPLHSCGRPQTMTDLHGRSASARPKMA